MSRMAPTDDDKFENHRKFFTACGSAIQAFEAPPEPNTTASEVATNHHDGHASVTNHKDAAHRSPSHSTSPKPRSLFNPLDPPLSTHTNVSCPIELKGTTHPAPGVENSQSRIQTWLSLPESHTYAPQGMRREHNVSTIELERICARVQGLTHHCVHEEEVVDAAVQDGVYTNQEKLRLALPQRQRPDRLEEDLMGIGHWVQDA
jgi:hypothetical protein